MTHEHITKKEMKNERRNFIMNCQQVFLGCATKSKIIEMNAQSLEVVFKNEFIISNSLSLFMSHNSLKSPLSLAVNLSIEKYHACGS